MRERERKEDSYFSVCLAAIFSVCIGIYKMYVRSGEDECIVRRLWVSRNLKWWLFFILKVGLDIA